MLRCEVLIAKNMLNLRAGAKVGARVGVAGTRLVQTVAVRCLALSPLSKPGDYSNLANYGRAKALMFTRTYAVDRFGEKIDNKIDDITDGQYNQISNMYLEDLGDELEAIGDDHPSIDFELSQGVLTLNTSKGTYVINRQPPNKQMWLSSPISGPNRYDLVGGQWVSLRDNGKLTELLSRELSDILGEEIGLQLQN